MMRRLTTLVASATVLAGLAVAPSAPAAAEDDHVTDASAWLMSQLLDLASGTENGGIYANKSGYHNTRAGNDPDDYSVRDPEDQGGPSDKAAAYDWTFPEAQGGSAVADASASEQFAGAVEVANVQALAAPDYTRISLYSRRLLASGQDSADPRLDGWKEFFGQTDWDNEVEGWDFRRDYASDSDKSHLWHIHLSEDRDKVESFDNKRALLSVLRGETVAEWNAPPAAHGPLYDRARTSAGAWAANSSLIDANAAINATAAAGTRDGSLYTFVVVPGNGTWTRAQSSSGVWAGNATRIDTNGAVTDVAAAALPDGSLHVFVLVPGSGVWHRSRTAAGVWAANSSRVDANGSVSDIAAVGLADGTLNLAVVVPQSGTWIRARSAAGVWASNSTQIDTNGAVSDVAYAGLPDNSLHLAVVVPNSGTWVRARTNGVWAANSTRVDGNGAVVDVSATGLADGTLHMAVVVPGSGTWVRARSAAGVWAANSSRIDTNGKVFKSYTAGTPNNTLHLGVLVNTA